MNTGKQTALALNKYATCPATDGCPSPRATQISSTTSPRTSWWHSQDRLPPTCDNHQSIYLLYIRSKRIKYTGTPHRLYNRYLHWQFTRTLSGDQKRRCCDMFHRRFFTSGIFVSSIENDMFHHTSRAASK